MAVEPDLNYSWLPPATSAGTSSSMEEVDLSSLISPPKVVLKEPPPPLNTLQLQEDTFVLTPVTQPFQIQVCIEGAFDTNRSQLSHHLQEPLNDPMLPFGGNKHLEVSSQHQGIVPSGGADYTTCFGSHFSPVSVHSLADSGVSSISNTTPERFIASRESPPSYLDFDLDQIVEDVDDMFRERYEALEMQKAEEEDSAKTSDLIKRNMPPEYFFTYTSKNPEELAHDLARSLVNKALESDRKKYLQQDPSVDLDNIFENWAEVGGNRSMEVIIDDLIGSAVNEMSTSIFHSYEGSMSKFKESSSRGNIVLPSEVLQDELDVLVSDIFAESDESCLVGKKFGLYQISGPSRIYDYKVPLSRQKIEEKAFVNRWKGNTSHVCTDECNRNRRIFITARMRREAERKRRNPAGILLSSLKKKVYHCRCIDCQQEREVKGVPEPSDSIEVKELQVPENIFPKEGIPILKKQGRGRPRKYPRVEDFCRWVHEQEKIKDGSLPMSKSEDQPSSTMPSHNNSPQTKKRPRGRPPKYQIQPQVEEGEDNLKIKLSRKRPSQLPYSKVNHIDCDSSDEGYSESLKDIAQDPQRDGCPSKRGKLNTIKECPPPPPPLPSTQLEPPIQITPEPASAPTSGEYLLQDPFSDSSCFDLLGAPVFPGRGNIIERNAILGSKHPQNNNHNIQISNNEKSPSKEKESDTNPQFIIIQKVSPSPESLNTIQSSSFNETGIQTRDNFMGNCSSEKISLGPISSAKKTTRSYLCISRSTQTDISFEVPLVSFSSPSNRSKSSKTSISVSTDISVCTSTNKLIHPAMHLSFEPLEKGSNGEVKESLKVKSTEKEISSPPPESMKQLIPEVQSDVYKSKGVFTEPKEIRTYSKKSSSYLQTDIWCIGGFTPLSMGGGTVMNLMSSPFKKVPIQSELLSFNLEEVMHQTVDFGQVLSVNEVLLEGLDVEEDGAFREYKQSWAVWEKIREPPKAKTISHLKVALQRLSEDVINSWCNRPPCGTSAPSRVISNADSFHDEIDLMKREKSGSWFTEKDLPLCELLSDAIYPYIQDKKYLRASKPLPVYYVST